LRKKEDLPGKISRVKKSLRFPVARVNQPLATGFSSSLEKSGRDGHGRKTGIIDH
jgi:hypothetical protein